MSQQDMIQFSEPRQTMTSFEIAEITGKRHKDVLRAIRKMEPAWKKVQGRNFALLLKIRELPNDGTKEEPYYVLTKTECLYVAAKFNDETRARLVLRWEQLERERQAQQDRPVAVQRPTVTPSPTRHQLLLMAVQAEEECERLREEKRQLEYDKLCMALELGRRYEIIQRAALPTTAALSVASTCRQPPATAAPVTAVTHSAAVTYTATQLAALYGMKAVSFNNLLQRLGLQYNVGGQWVIAADYAGNGYCATKHINVTSIDGGAVRKPFTVWTEAGRQFLQQMLRTRGIMTAGEERAARREAQKGGRHV